MFLENLGIDATDPVRLGRFWEAALGTTVLTVEPDLYETRLVIDGESYLDLGQGEVPWTVLADVEGTAFRVREEREELPGTAPRTLRHPSGRGPLLELLPAPVAAS